jgi:hypothetical protein
MTPDYIYNEMTWAEVSDALDYCHAYDMGEQHFAAGAWKKGKKITDWWQRKRPRADALRDFARKFGGG